MVKILVLDDPGWQFFGVTTCCLANDFGEILSYFGPNIFLWLFYIIKGPNWEVICILPIFGVIFRQNLGTWSPEVTLYSVITCCLVIYFGEILSYFVPNIFLRLFYIIKGYKWGRYLHITNIWGRFWSKCGYFSPRGDPI